MWLATGSSVRAQVTESVSIEAVQVPLNPEDPAQNRVGRLTYQGGLALVSRHPRFGGLSGLIVDRSGRHFLAVSDRAYWWTGRFYFRDGTLAEVDDVATGPLADSAAKPFVGIQTDAEALEITPDGVVYIGFERDHRIVRFNLADRDDFRSVFYAPGQNLPRFPALREAPGNGGAEALTVLGRDLQLVVTEELQGREPGTVAGWLIYNSIYAPLSYRPQAYFSPTDMTVLPDGDLLVLERLYSPLTGVAARLCILARDTIVPDATLGCETVADLRPPLTIDNFEGVHARRNDAGETLIYLLSDDNFSPDQRTLLMIFRLEPEGS